MKRWSKKSWDKHIDDEKDKLKKQYRAKGISDRVAEYVVLDDIFDDLPDGAYFAAMAEHGFEAEDIIECNEKAVELGIL